MQDKKFIMNEYCLSCNERYHDCEEHLKYHNRTQKLDCWKEREPFNIIKQSNNMETNKEEPIRYKIAISGEHKNYKGHNDIYGPRYNHEFIEIMKLLNELGRSWYAIEDMKYECGLKKPYHLALDIDQTTGAECVDGYTVSFTLKPQVKKELSLEQKMELRKQAMNTAMHESPPDKFLSSLPNNNYDIIKKAEEIYNWLVKDL